VNAIDNPKVSGERVILYESDLWFQQVGQILVDEGFKKAPTKEMANWMVKMIGLFDKSLKLLIPHLGKERKCNSQKAQELLGMYTKTSKQAFIESAKSVS
jgi:dihydroflavonol-4-reductase